MATYGCSVKMAISGNRVEGTRGFSEFLEKISDGLFLTKLDASLAENEYAVSAAPHTSVDPGNWSVSALKITNVPNLPPATYVAVAIARNGMPEDHDFDVLVQTFR